VSNSVEAKDGLCQQMTQLILSLARTLVDEPDEVRVESIDEATGTMLRLHVAPADLGKVIGKQGRTARSIRTILAAASMKAQYRFSLDIQQTGPPGGSVQDAGDASALDQV
jgi:predicted RNA-binding protein YlqC (UPF0109 family)